MKTETKQAVNLFSIAKKVEPKKKATEEKNVIPCDLNLKRWSELKELIADSEAEQKMIEGEIKEQAKAKFLELYQQQRSRPESFIFEGADSGRCMIIVQDRYITVTEEKLSSFDLADNCIEKLQDFSFNPELLEKYSGVISEMIVNSKKIADEDKGQLILVKEKTVIKKGLINSLYSFGERMKDVFNFAEPIMNLKNAR